MKIYFASSRLSLKDPATWVAGIADAGFDGWEVSMDGRFHRISDLTRLMPEIRTTLNETGLEGSIHAPFSGLNPGSLNADIWNATVSQLSACIEATADISNKIVLHPGYLEPNARDNSSLSWQRHKEAIVHLGKIAEQTGVTACLENMPNLEDFYCRDPYELEGFTDDVDGVRMTLDMGHANTNGTLDQFCRIVLSKAFHLHIHDNFGKYDEHLPLGKGSIPWDTVMPTVVKKYRGDIIVVEGRNPSEGKESLEYLRKWF